MRHSLILLAAASATALIVSGCARNEAAEPKAAPLPQVSVAPVISRKVTESDEFTGRFEAVARPSADTSLALLPMHRRTVPGTQQYPLGADPRAATVFWNHNHEWENPCATPLYYSPPLPPPR